MTLQEEILQEEEDLARRIYLNERPRLGEARRYLVSLDREKIPSVLALFKAWRNTSEYMLMKREERVSGKKTFFAVKCSKRGNDVFARRLDSRLGFLKADDSFFDPTSKKPLKTRLLWVTLTYDPSRRSLHDAWENIGDDFNLWIQNLRNKYGRISYVSFIQAFPGVGGEAFGYPHFHVIMLFQDREFKVFPHMEKDRQGRAGLVFRIQEKPEIEEQGKWSAHVDIRALSSMRAVWNYAKKHCYNAGYGSSDDAILNNAVMWFYRKKSFNMSGDFRDRYIEFIRSMHNSKVVAQETLEGRLLQDAKITVCGFFTVFQLDWHGEGDPPWSLDISKEEADRLINRPWERG